MKKRFIVFDSSYGCREHIGFIEGSDEKEIKDILKKLFVSNYGDEKSFKDCDITEIDVNMSKEKIEEEYSDGLNWLDDLRDVDCNELVKGRKEKEKYFNKLKENKNRIGRGLYKNGKHK